MKPELSAPGTKISIDIYQDMSGNPLGCNSTNTNCSGTSFSAPHVTGVLANAFSNVSLINMLTLTPALAKSLAILGATDSVIGGGSKVGFGGIDYQYIHYPSAYWWHIGYWANIEANDDIPGNGQIDDFITLSANPIRDVRIAVAWLNRGSWTYAHRDNTYPMGIGFKIYVYSPIGGLIQTSMDRYNGFALFSFPVLASGQYHIVIKPLAMSDMSSGINMAIAVAN